MLKTTGTQTTMKGSIRKVSKAERDQEESERMKKIMKLAREIREIEKAEKEAKIQAAKELLKNEARNNWPYYK